jgi:hypothetical protein
MAISIENLEKLEHLFETKKWEIVKDTALFSSLFNRFCSRLDLFDNEKQEMIIELGHRFLNLVDSDFQTCFTDAVSKIQDIDNYNSIIIAPLKQPSITETKSSDALWYHLKNFCDFSYNSFGKKLFFSSDWEVIKKSLDNANVILILIDDFVGTGETVNETLTELYDSDFINTEQNVKIITFAAQVEGAQKVHKRFGDILFYSISLNKGLSDCYDAEDLEKKTILMREIETTLRVKDEYKFGYGSSESLFAVRRRSANNTFPVFWLETKKRLSPFKR